MFVAKRGAGDEEEAQAGRPFLNDNIPKIRDRENEEKKCNLQRSRITILTDTSLFALSIYQAFPLFLS